MGNNPSTLFPNPNNAEPLPPVAYVDCGSGNNDHSADDDVSFFGTDSVHSAGSTISIKGDNADFVSFGRSHRWAPSDFGYAIKVPVAGQYDITLVFCETYEPVATPGGRVFDVVVEGIQTKTFADVDVAAKVGLNSIYTIKLDNFEADYEIRVHLRKGKSENPFISGLVVGAVENAADPPLMPEIPQPNVQVTAEAYAECERKIKEYIAAQEAKAPSRVRERPWAMFHPPGTKVRGLVVTFHGFSGQPYDHRILGKYLYRNGFDVFHTMLSKHMYTGHHWPKTLLSDEYGGDTLPALVAKDEEAKFLLQKIQTDPLSIPKLFARLRQIDPDFARMPSANDYVAAIEDDEHPQFNKYFTSNHRDYLIDGEEQLALVSSHPGPVVVTGLSVGGAAALAVSGSNADRISRCVTMAPLLEIWEPTPNTRRAMANYLGPLSIAPDFAWDPSNPFPVSALTAAGRLGGAITSSEKMKTAFRDKCKIFMILTADEDAADVPTNKKFFADCGGARAGHKYHFYPMNYKVPHPLLDPTARSRGLRNDYYKPMYQEIFRFLCTGEIYAPHLLTKNIDPTLPAPQDALPGWRDYRSKD